MAKVKRSVWGGIAHWTLDLERRLSFLSAGETAMNDDLPASVSPLAKVRPVGQTGRLRPASSVDSHAARQLTGGAPRGRRES